MQNSGWGMSRSVERGPHKLLSAFMDPDDRIIMALQCKQPIGSITDEKLGDMQILQLSRPRD